MINTFGWCTKFDLRIGSEICLIVMKIMSQCQKSGPETEVFFQMILGGIWAEHVRRLCETELNLSESLSLSVQQKVRGSVMRCSFICHSDVWRLSLQTFTSFSLCSRYLHIILSFGYLTDAFLSYYVLLMDLLFNMKWHEIHDWLLEVYDWRIIHYEGNSLLCPTSRWR